MAMKSAPTTALEAMLDLPSLPDTVKKEAAQSAFRMLDQIKPKAGDMQGHLEIYKDFKEIMELEVLSDKMPVRHDFEAPFEVEITEREECVNPTTHPVHLFIILVARERTVWSEWEFMVLP
jgi:hypothetical protein